MLGDMKTVNKLLEEFKRNEVNYLGQDAQGRTALHCTVIAHNDKLVSFFWSKVVIQISKTKME
ncbi:hypothetical protein LLB_3271 [Legionella longbeachae D-4968]|nr:hypothetical protein LLB_3271 [Legionella longbeachae D-4968]